MNYQSGDLVKSKITGEIGLVIKPHRFYANYYNVFFPNGTYTINTSDLKPLEKQ